MGNYKIWKTDYDLEVIIEFWDEDSVRVIQKELIEKGYYITRTRFNVFDNHHLMKAIKIDEASNE